MKTAALLARACKIREREHRLKPSLRLQSFGDIRRFVAEKGLVSTLGGNELPSLVSAILGKSWKPTGKGFTSWLDWWNVRVSGHRVAYWQRELANGKDALETRIFRKTKTLVARRLWPILDSIVGHYEELASRHEILSEPEWRILDLLKEKGPTRTDRIRLALRLEGRQNTAPFHKSLARLESFGLIVGSEDPKPERHLHANIWQLWNTTHSTHYRGTSLSYEKAIAELLRETIDAAVVVQGKDVENWFEWNGAVLEAKEDIVSTGRVIPAPPFLLSSRVAKNT